MIHTQLIASRLLWFPKDGPSMNGQQELGQEYPISLVYLMKIIMKSSHMVKPVLHCLAPLQFIF